MPRTLTLTRPAILAGFMLLFECSVGEGAQVLPNGASRTFPLTEGEHTLTVKLMNNPKIPDPEPVAIPAGTEDLRATLVCKNVNGLPRWFVELD